MSTRALVLSLGVSGFAVGLWLNTSLKPRSSYGDPETPASLSLHVCEIHKRAQYSVAIIQPW